MSIARCVFCHKEKRVPAVGGLGVALSPEDVASMRFCCQPSCFKAFHSNGTYVDVRQTTLVAPSVILMDMEAQRREVVGTVADPLPLPRTSSTPPPTLIAPLALQSSTSMAPKSFGESSARIFPGKRQKTEHGALPPLSVGFQPRVSTASHSSPIHASETAHEPTPVPNNPLQLWKQASYVPSLDRFRRSLPSDDDHVYRVDLTTIYSGMSQACLNDAETDCLLRCLEETSSLTVIKGLIAGFNIDLWTVTNFLDSCPSNLHWSFSHFKMYKPNEMPVNGTISNLYYAGEIALSMAEFRKYIFATQRGAASVVSVVDVNNKAWSIAVHEVLALNDLNLELHCGEMYMDLVRQFGWQGVLPGGKDCCLQYVPKPYRNERFTPRLHCSFAGNRSELLSAANGSTDMVYQVIHGELDFIVFDQYPAVAYDRVVDFLKRMGHQPHQRGDILAKYLDNLKKFGYVSHRVRLQPGEFLHINRGRLHMWRSVDESETAGRGFSMFLSWEWVFQGVSVAGIADSATYSFQRAQRPLPGPGPRVQPFVFDPRLYLIEAARQLVAAARSTTRPRRAAQITGRLAALSNVLYALLQEEQRLQSEGDDSWFVHARHADMHLHHTVDHGLSPELLQCSVCRIELSNSYKQCLGCTILSKKASPVRVPRFNLCLPCFYADADNHETYQPHSLRSVAGHVGCLLHSKQYREHPETVECRCSGAKACPVCDGCDACACICHTMFQTRYRAQRPDELVHLFGAVSAIAQGSPPQPLGVVNMSLHRNNAVLNLAALAPPETPATAKKLKDAMDFDIWYEALADVDVGRLPRSAAVPIAVPFAGPLGRRESALEARTPLPLKAARGHTI
ncbi:hypothetical protein ACHHYP_05264 [Achlya hypogyna]|uniref:JmjC domain-containing protein n=1 Tax=Achlya hypogyna TaxID=1202772 RepID=A0A1V9YYM9_ACHHY|nr:hypothetical protein ACHHYP_05264 [Achlya hypogyna]